jgi:hypothetical protein
VDKGSFCREKTERNPVRAELFKNQASHANKKQLVPQKQKDKIVPHPRSNVWRNPNPPNKTHQKSGVDCKGSPGPTIIGSDFLTSVANKCAENRRRVSYDKRVGCTR